MPRFASLAEKHRHHRKCMEIAMATGCTPKEAEIKLALRELAAKRRAREAAREARKAARHAQLDAESAARAGDHDEFDTPWMMRG